MHIEPGLCPSIVDIVVAMNEKVRKRIGAQKRNLCISIHITEFMYQ